MSSDGQPPTAQILQPVIDMIARQGITASLQVLIIWMAFQYGPKFAEEAISLTRTLSETQRQQTDNIGKLVSLHEKTTVAIEQVSSNLQRIMEAPASMPKASPPKPTKSDIEN